MVTSDNILIKVYGYVNLFQTKSGFVTLVFSVDSKYCYQIIDDTGHIHSFLSIEKKMLPYVERIENVKIETSLNVGAAALYCFKIEDLYEIGTKKSLADNLFRYYDKIKDDYTKLQLLKFIEVESLNKLKLNLENKLSFITHFKGLPVRDQDRNIEETKLKHKYDTWEDKPYDINRDLIFPEISPALYWHNYNEAINGWEKCLEYIKAKIPSSSFKTWFEPIKALKLENSILTIQVPSAFFFEHLEEQFIDVLRLTLRSVIGKNAKLVYEVMLENKSKTQSCEVNFPIHDIRPIKTRPLVIPLKSKVSAPVKNSNSISDIKKLKIDPALKPDNIFENFVEGDCNRLARSAGFAVAQNPGGTAFNPLMIYGNSGLGKTHLVQAIGNEVKQLFPDKVVLYVNAYKFLIQFTEATRNSNQNDFLNFYQMVDVLILDDVHEFAGKEKFQETLFHIFNHLYQMGKQLILTSDKPPIELKGMEQRLLSRFKWGLTADLQIPDFETRMEILRLKTDKDGISLSEEVLEYIASHIINNVRELEGALVSLLAQSMLNKREITLELTVKLINKLVKNSKSELSIEYISKVVCDYFNMPVEALQAKTRKTKIIQARQIAMYFSKSLTKYSLASIGAQIGSKDHATVLHACKTVSYLKDSDKDFRLIVEEIEEKLKV